MSKTVAVLGLCFALAPFCADAFERAPLPSEAPMEPCPREGVGFVRIPGTTTCIRLSGRASAGVDVGTRHSEAPVQGRISVDSRSESGLGPVRSFVRIDAGRR
ncbi:porin [Methylorubrum populi]|uniref:Porin n=1 Tax=Methylorubrum populi TaxID=223967 RepID=A0A921JGX1_9HYPH|nr:porin [Methylorubrum populi]